MKKRLALHEELCGVLGSRNVYFQPPENLKMSYPCIVYKRSEDWIKHANDRRYIIKEGYDLTVISTDPDSEIPDDILEHFDYCKLDRPFVSDNLNHTTLRLYY